MINEQYTQLFEQRDDLIKLMKIAEEANEEKLRFFTNISHEFRTLISMISLPLNRLLETEIAVEIRDKLDIMSKNASRLSKLAQEILKFRKIDTNRYKFNFQESDIVEFTREVIDSFRLKAQEKEVILTADMPLQLMVEFDSPCMEKVLFNLLSNAVKHTDKEGIIYIRLGLENSYLKIDIKDTGRGIPKNEIPLIFDRFFRGNNYGLNDEDNGGMGIGLALCKELLSLHGGTIRVSSKVGKGSTFTILIPQYHDHPGINKKQTSPSVNDQSPGRELEKGSEKEPVKEPEHEFNQDKTVLIVEDNSELRSIIAELVGKYYKVVVAEDGLDGLKKAIDTIPDLILSDILMPCMDGIQMTRDLKKHPSTYHIPVILLTAIDSQESTIKGFDTGADDYIIKPFNESLLITRIQNLIESRTRILNKYGKNFFSVDDLNIEDNISKEFINRMIKIIYDNASRESYSLNHLATDMNLSRSSLYRRIKELTGMKAIDFMKKIRLSYAARLLINHDLTINEVAWRTGFSDAKYFSKCFCKEYGQVPSKFKVNLSEVP